MTSEEIKASGLEEEIRENYDFAKRDLNLEKAKLELQLRKLNKKIGSFNIHDFADEFIENCGSYYYYKKGK